MDHATNLSNLALIAKSDFQLLQKNLNNISNSIEYFQQYPEYLLKKVGDLGLFESDLFDIHIYESSEDTCGTTTHLKDEQLLFTSTIFYKLTNVINYKKLIQYLPNNNEFIPILIDLIEFHSSNPRPSEIHFLKGSYSDEDRWIVLNFLCNWLLLLLMNPFKLDYEVNKKIFDLVFGLNMVSKCNSYLLAILLNKEEKLLKEYSEQIDLNIINQFLKMKNDSKIISTDILNDWKYLIYSVDVSDTKNYNASLLVLLKVVPKLTKYYNSKEYIFELLNWYVNTINGRKAAYENSSLIENTDSRFKFAKSFVCFLKVFDEQSILNVYNTVIYPTSDDDLDILHLKLLCVASMIRYLDKDLVDRSFLTKFKILPIINQYFDFQNKESALLESSNDSLFNKIRDSINFIVWALIRSKNNVLSIENKYLKMQTQVDIFMKLLCSAVFDYDLNIRRSALATLHELLGRSKFLNNITIVELMTILDIINMDKIYSKVIPQIFQLFESQNYIQYNYLLLERMVLNNIAIFKKINIIKHSTNCLLYFFKTSDDYREKIKMINTKFSCTNENIYQYLYYFTTISEHETLCENIEVLFNELKSSRVKSHSPPTSFQYLSILKTLNHFIRTKDSFNLQIHNLDHVVNCFIYSNKISNGIEFNEFKDELVKIVQYLESSKALTEKTSEYWREWYLKLLSSKNVMLYGLIPHMDQLYENENNLLYYLKESDYITKSALINSLSTHFHKIVTKTPKTAYLILLTLDDYTLTQRGDVGRIVRESCCSLVSANLDYFMNKKELIIPKLLRIAAEPIEALQKISFEVIKRLYNIKYSGDYFSQLFKFYQNFAIGYKKDFLQGVVATCGAIHSTDRQITESLNALLDYYHDSLLNELGKLGLLNDLVRMFPSIDSIKAYKQGVLIKNGINSPQKDQLKTLLTTFKFWERFLQNNVVLNEESFNYKGFFAKIYNIHLFSKNIKVTESFVVVSSLICCNIIKQKFDENFTVLVQSKIKTVAKSLPRLSHTCHESLNLIDLYLYKV